nr:hypothetical protein [Tanacetum cinerariifolium]
NAGNLNGYNAVQNVRNQVAQNPRVQNVRNQNGLMGVQGNAADLDEIKEVNANCILMGNLQQASSSVPQNDNEVISKVTGVEQDGGTVEQHFANFEETRALYESLYQNLAVEV